MNDERLREIMKQTPYPESLSVLMALKQVANEVEQEVRESLGAKWGGTSSK